MSQMTGATVEEATERRNTMIGMLKAAGAEGLTRKELSDTIGVTTTTVTNYIRFINKDGELIKIKDGKTPIVYWNGENDKVITMPEKKVTAAEKVELVERYDDKKNDEGYSDPTAYAAMKEITPRQKPGDIWVNDFNGTEALYFVLAATPKYVTCVQLFEHFTDVPECERKDMLPVRYSERASYYFNPVRIYTRPAKYFKQREGFLGKAFEYISGKVNEYLCLSPKVVVEKVVEKKVEVPVEVEKEVPVEVEKIIYKENPETDNGYEERIMKLEEELKEVKELLTLSEHENELKTQRGDIWETVAKSLLNGRSN